MDEQQGNSVRTSELTETEFKYIVHIRAFEAFRNVLRREGVMIPEGSTYVSFSSPKRLDMRVCKERGLVWSYTAIRVRKEEEVLEEG